MNENLRFMSSHLMEASITLAFKFFLFLCIFQSERTLEDSKQEWQIISFLESASKWCVWRLWKKHYCLYTLTINEKERKCLMQCIDETKMNYHLSISKWTWNIRHHYHPKVEHFSWFTTKSQLLQIDIILSWYDRF